MTKADATPRYPTHFQLVPGASFSKAPTGLNCVLRPITNSAITIDNPTTRIQAKYISVKAPPPFWPAIEGYFQIFPIPTAEPDAARINPNFDPHCSRF